MLILIATSASNARSQLHAACCAGFTRHDAWVSCGKPSDNAKAPVGGEVAVGVAMRLASYMDELLLLSAAAALW